MKTDLPPEERAREYVLSALERRMHSRRELELKLRRKGIPETVFGAVLDRLSEVGLVDDEAFARAYLESRQRRRPRGRRALLSELLQKGVDREVAERVVEEIGEDDPESALRALQPRRRSLEGLPEDQARRKATEFLMRRGFPYDVAEQAVRQFLAIPS